LVERLSCSCDNMVDGIQYHVQQNFKSLTLIHKHHPLKHLL
jgi:hypothetical protein